MKELLLKNNKKLIKILIVVLAVVLVIFFATISLLSNKTVYVPRPKYDRSRFTHIDEFEEDKVISINNSRFSFKMNVSTTTFELTDNKTGEVWLSNPEKTTSNFPAELEELFVVYYERELEVPKSISVKERSVENKDYFLNVQDNIIEVLYEVGRDDSLTILDLPRRVGKDKFEEKILDPLTIKKDNGDISSRHYRFLVAQYLYMEEQDLYYLRDVTTEDGLNILYNLIFEESLYTKEDLVEDSKTYNFPLEVAIPYFEFVVRYELNENGLNLRIINDSIYETEEYPMAYIDVLPYFGVSNIGDSGQTIIPDGSGIVINHDNGKYGYPNYEKRLYGRDLSIGTQNEVLSAKEETIKMPMYGYIKNNKGFINVLENSEGMASIRAGFTTSGGAGNYSNIVPWVGFRYMLRERDSYTFSTYYMTQRVSLWTKEYNKEDYVSSYIFGEDTKNYYDIAQLYQEYLVKRYNLEKINSNNIMHITVLGGYKRKKHFLGFPYDSVQSLTTPKELLSIAEQIDNTKGSVDYSYVGWSNEGIRPTSMNKIKYNNNIASKKEVKKLISDMEELNNTLYLEFNTQSAYTDKYVKKKKDVANNIFHKNIVYYQYDQATKLADKSTMPNFRLTTNKQIDIYKRLNKIDFIDNVVLSDEAQLLATEFRSKNNTFRNQIIDQNIENMESLNKNFILRNSNIYGTVLTDKIIDVSNIGTINRIVDYDIPFQQLIYNGYFNYSAPSANLDTSKSLTWHKLKAIETASRMQFTLSYEDTVNLLKTEYSNYYSTYYNNWLKEINDLIGLLDLYGIYDSTIVNHETLNIQGTKVEVTYSNGKKFIINYDNETIIESRV